MAQRLIQAIVVAAIAGGVGAGIAVNGDIEPAFGVAAACAGIGFFFGLFFTFRLF